MWGWPPRPRAGTLQIPLQQKQLLLFIDTFKRPPGVSTKKDRVGGVGKVPNFPGLRCILDLAAFGLSAVQCCPPSRLRAISSENSLVANVCHATCSPLW